MLNRIGRYARTHHLALLALFFALGGTSFAAASKLLPANSVGTKQLRKNAVTGVKVKDNSVTGKDVLESSLGLVPSASHARTADSANSANSAANSSALGGTPASSFYTKPEVDAKTGQNLATWGVAAAGDSAIATIPGLGDIHLQCATTGPIAVYYLNTSATGHRVWVEDDGSHGGSGLNGDSAFVPAGQHWNAQGGAPVEGSPLGTVTNSSGQLVTWLISGNTPTAGAVVHVGLSRSGGGCPYMVSGNVLG